MKNRRPAEAGRRFDVSADYRSDVDGELVEPFVDGAVEPPELPEPLEPPMFGQSPGEPEWVRGAVPPVLPLPDGCVVAFGAAEADGSAADTTATPPTARRPIARSVVATSRLAPPKDDCGSLGESDGATGGHGAGWLAGGSVQDIVDSFMRVGSVPASSLVHRHLREAGLDRDQIGRGQIDGPSPAVRRGPSPTAGAAPTAYGSAGAPRRTDRSVGEHGVHRRAHGNRLNQCAASPAPPTTRRSPAAANHWVTSRSSVV